MSKNKEKISLWFSQEKRERLKSILDNTKKEVLSTSESNGKIWIWYSN